VKRGALIAVLLAIGVGLWAFPRAGRYLVMDAPLQPADVVVVLAGTRVERWLEAVELYREKVAPRILLSSGRIEPAEQALRERGIRFPREADLVKEAMLQLGVAGSDIDIFPESVDNTAAEATSAREIILRRGWRRVIVVTSKYHTRRSRYAFQREFSGTGIDVQVRGTRFDTAKPDEWWKHRPDLRFVISEWQKLVAYRLGLEG
jgi:uncharacterized SAM-binding protein YcdF (DUF218 family)